MIRNNLIYLKLFLQVGQLHCTWLVRYVTSVPIFFSKLNLLKTIFYLLITSSLFITINCEDPLHKSPNVSLFHPNLSFYSSFTNLFVCVWERLHKLFQLTRGCLTMRCFFSAWFISLASNRIIKLETFDLWFCSLYLF